MNLIAPWMIILPPYYHYDHYYYYHHHYHWWYCMSIFRIICRCTYIHICIWQYYDMMVVISLLHYLVIMWSSTVRDVHPPPVPATEIAAIAMDRSQVKVKDPIIRHEMIRHDSYWWVGFIEMPSHLISFLVGGLSPIPLKNMKVNWDDYPQLNGKINNVPNQQPDSLQFIQKWDPENMTAMQDNYLS